MSEKLWPLSYEKWVEKAKKYTSGEQVWDILNAWKDERDALAVQVAELERERDALLLVRNALNSKVSELTKKLAIAEQGLTDISLTVWDDESLVSPQGLLRLMAKNALATLKSDSEGR